MLSCYNVPDKITPTLEAKISLSRLSQNLKLIRRAIGPKVTVMAVVKSNAYGHGLVPIAEYLFGQGVGYFGVARLEEALLLSRSLPKARILILSPILPENFALALKKNITLTVTEKTHLPQLQKAAQKTKKKARIHLKVDTGLNRSGVEPEAVLPFVKLAVSFENVSLEGIFTHFANASDDRAFTKKQLSTFQKVITDLKTKRVFPKYIHASATAAIFKYKEAHFNLVRPGLGLYGHFPDHGQTFGLKPILSLFTQINRIHLVKKGETVGYNRTYLAKKNLLAATLCAGYADGLRRAPISWPYVSIKRQLAPIIGRMSMDQAIVDITKVKPQPTLKTTVVLLSGQPNSPVSLETIAEKIGASPYEVLTSLHERVTRTYVKMR